MEIREVAVVGLGTMGAGIAEVFARAGIGVVAIEADAEAMSRGVGILDASLSRAVTRGRLTAAEQAEIRSRVRLAAGFSEAAALSMAKGITSSTSTLIQAESKELVTESNVASENVLIHSACVSGATSCTRVRYSRTYQLCVPNITLPISTSSGRLPQGFVCI